MIDRRRLLAAASILAGDGLATAGRAAGAPVGRPGVGRDLQGVWTLGSYTNLERPKELKALVLTPAEAEAYEAPRRALHGVPASKPGELGQQESEFNERGDGLARVRGEIRSSWIIDPPDGHIPYTAEAKARLGIYKPEAGRPIDNPEDLNGTTRCMGNTAAGAPMIGAPDTNLLQIVQTPTVIAILTEKYHDVRLVRMGVPAAPVRSWLGESVGRWEGDTLVIETAGFRPGFTSRVFWVSGDTRVVERLRRIDSGDLFYEFTVEDPSLFTRPWRGEMTLRPAKGAIFEYACHEGNYSLPSILRAARMADKTAKP